MALRWPHRRKALTTAEPCFMSNSFFDRKIDTEDLILRFMVFLAIACHIVMRLPTEERIDLETLRKLQDQASDLNIEFDEDTTIKELEEAVTEALAERNYGHPSLTPAQRNRPRGFL